MIKIVFVCLGNICRSPMAEFLFKKYLDDRGVGNHFMITSRATSSYETGNGIYPGTRKILDKFNIDYKSKVSEQINENDFINNDYIICMDKNNYNYLINYKDGKYRNKVFTWLEKKDVLDPWYTGDFDRTYEDLVNEFDRWYKIVSRDNY